MFADKLEGDSFFGRLTGFDISCPRCGCVQIVSPQHHTKKYRMRKEKPEQASKVWNPDIQRFQCPKCLLVLMLGIYAWPAPIGGRGMSPPDTIPSWEESMQIRALWGAYLARRKLRWKEPINVAGKEECSCRTTMRGIWRNARCPVHGGIK